jgi:biotin carboxyl carrier protein
MISRHAVTIDGRTRSVEIEDVEGNQMRVVVDGFERVLDIRALAGGVWSLLDGVGARLIQVDGTGTKLTVEVSHPDGEPRLSQAEVTDAQPAGASAGPAATGTGPVTLQAPIPGRLVKVLVKADDAVTAGQPLLVLEAMKMENELRAPRAGVVATVHVNEGAAVETGQALISLR